jgi:transcriptional regulator with XRE-family HTH domain
MEENIVKKTCKELGLTYKQLGEAIGYSENAVSNASRAEVSKTMAKAINLYIKTINQEKELEKLEALRNTLKSILN